MNAISRLRGGISALAIVTTVAACGGEPAQQPSNASQGQTTSTPAPATATTPPAGGATVAPAPATGKTIDVQMVGDAQGYRFVPDRITIQRGDQVRWTMVSGGPHNVTFWTDSIPSGAAGPLGANMPGTTQPLEGPLLLNPNQTYTVSFAGAPTGTYRYYCTPHLALGMKAVVEVK